MKHKSLMVLGSIFVLSVLSYVSVMSTVGQCDLSIFCTNFYESNLGGGSIDMDPDLSPSYALDFAFSWNSIFVFVPLIFGVIATILLSTHFILKKKNIPSRPYIVLILSGILLHHGITSLIPWGNQIPATLHLLDKEPSFFIQQVLPQFLTSVIALAIAGILLYKSSVIRGLLKR